MFRLISCGHQYVHPDGLEINRPKGAGNYSFVLFKSEAELLVNGDMRAVPAHYCVLYRPDTPQLYRGRTHPFINDWLHFDGDGVPEFLGGIEFPVDEPLAVSDPLAVSRWVMEIQTFQRHGGVHISELLDGLLRCFFLKLRVMPNQLQLNNRNRRYYQKFSQLRRQIYRIPDSSARIEQLAEDLNLSPSYFQHVYKELFGVSVKADIITSRLEHAKYLLLSGSYSVAQTASMCGYENYVHFIRQFKEHVGVTPGKYVYNGHLDKK